MSRGRTKNEELPRETTGVSDGFPSSVCLRVWKVGLGVGQEPEQKTKRVLLTILFDNRLSYRFYNGN